MSVGYIISLDHIRCFTFASMFSRKYLINFSTPPNTSNYNVHSSMLPNLNKISIIIIHENYEIWKPYIRFCHWAYFDGNNGKWQEHRIKSWINYDQTLQSMLTYPLGWRTIQQIIEFLLFDVFLYIDILHNKSCDLFEITYSYIYFGVFSI